MRSKRAIDIQYDLQNRVREIVGSAKTFHSTHAEMLEKYSRLYDKYPKDLPVSVKSYIRGYYSALVDSLYHRELVHGYLWNGKVCTNWDLYSVELKRRVMDDADSIPHGHWWKDTVETGENKPFFLGKAGVK